MLTQVAAALVRLHGAGWALLGLWPSVVALGRPIQITDFSFARPFGEPPRAAQKHIGYSPPEAVLQAPADVRADIYAVGAMLFTSSTARLCPRAGPTCAPGTRRKYLQARPRFCTVAQARPRRATPTQRSCTEIWCA